MKEKYLVLLLMVLISSFAMSQMSSKVNYQLIPFGEGGTKKMTCDCRQHPQVKLMGDEIHNVYNAGAPTEVSKLEKTLPFATAYYLKTGKFAKSVQLPGEPGKNHLMIKGNEGSTNN